MTMSKSAARRPTEKARERAERSRAATWDRAFESASRALDRAERATQQLGHREAAVTVQLAQARFATRIAKLCVTAPNAERAAVALEWLKLIDAMFAGLDPGRDDVVTYLLGSFEALSGLTPPGQAVAAAMTPAYLEKLAGFGRQRRVGTEPMLMQVEMSPDSIAAARQRLETFEAKMRERDREAELPSLRANKRIVLDAYLAWLRWRCQMSLGAIVTHMRDLTHSWSERFAGGRTEQWPRAAVAAFLETLPKHQHLLFLEWLRLTEVGEEFGEEDAEQSVAKRIRGLHPVRRESDGLPMRVGGFLRP